MKAKVAKLGTGEKAKATVILKDEKKIKGYIGQAGSDDFVLRDRKTDTPTKPVFPSHVSATALETPHETGTQITISDALRRHAQSVINDRSIDPQWRAIIRYALETNDPWLPDLVRRADAGETIIDTIDFLQTPDTVEDDSIEEKISALAEIICQ